MNDSEKNNKENNKKKLYDDDTTNYKRIKILDWCRVEISTKYAIALRQNVKVSHGLQWDGEREKERIQKTQRGQIQFSARMEQWH